MGRKVNSATWWSSLKGTKGSIPVSFTLTLDNSETVELTNCFNTWPQPKNAACTSSGGVLKKVVAKPQPAPKKVTVAPKKPVASSTRCGKSWAVANSKCGTPCTSDAQCVATGEKCFKDLSSAPCTATTQPAPKNVAKRLTAKKATPPTTAAAPTTTTTTTAARSTTTTTTTTATTTAPTVTTTTTKATTTTTTT